MKNPAREKFLPMLSPYVDGELTPEERQQVEAHLAANKESAMLVADLRAGGGLVRQSLDLAADDVDWKDFTAKVMANVTPEKLPFFERMSLTFSEMFLYQRGFMVGGLVGAAAMVAVLVPVGYSMTQRPPQGYENARVEVQTVAVDDSSPTPVHPVVMETDSGDAVIWMVESNDHKQDGGKKKKKDGEEGEEELNVTPTKKEGDL